MKYDIFISYSRRDLDIVRDFYERLSAEGFRVWIDMKGLYSGDQFKRELTQAIIAVCESPKSNSVAVALEKSAADAEKGGFKSVPAHLRDTHYKGSARLGSGQGYLYPHDFPGHYVRQQYAPPEAGGMPYYVPSDQGQELKIGQRKWEREHGGEK